MPTHHHAEDSRPTFAILDWGIGGMGFYRVFKENYPEVGVCYFSDSGSVPYGQQQKGPLLKRLGLVVEFLRDQGITHLVVACNAASTVLPYWSLPEDVTNFYVSGVIEPAISAALVRGGERISVVGGRRTILSGAYSRPLRKAFRKVTQRVAQPLSALIEKGEIDTPFFKTTLEKIMLPLQETDVLLLACTHYEAAQDAFQGLAPHAQIINPALETFRRVVGNWSLTKTFAPDIFYTTGNPADMRDSSIKAFGIIIGEITCIPLGLNGVGIEQKGDSNYVRPDSTEDRIKFKQQNL